MIKKSLKSIFYKLFGQINLWVWWGLTINRKYSNKLLVLKLDYRFLELIVLFLKLNQNSKDLFKLKNKNQDDQHLWRINCD